MAKLALQAVSWYNTRNIVRPDDTSIPSGQKHNLSRLIQRSCCEYDSTLILHLLQLSSCFPLDKWRKDNMGVPKDPEKYAEWVRKQSESHKGQKVSEEGKRQRALDMIERRKDPVFMQKLMDGIANREMTEEYRHKLREAAKDRTFTEEARQKSIQTRRERGVSEETRRKHSEASKGNTYGKNLSKESRQRASERVKANPPRKGYKMTPEERQEHIERMRLAAHKISAKVKASWDSLSEEEKSERIIHALAATSHKPSSLEVQVSEYLTILGIAHETQFRIGRYKADIYIPELNLILEIMGCYWHGCEECGYSNPEKQEQDKKRYEVITSKGYAVVFLWEHSIKADLGQAILQAMEGYT